MAHSAAFSFLLYWLFSQGVSCVSIKNINVSWSEPLSLTTRQDQITSNSCSTSGYTSCGNGLPDDFCCPSGSICLSIASNTTAICCPDGMDCGVIQSITCDIQRQNVATHPESVIHTTDLEGSLPTCGTNCCPFGYTCNEDLDCILNDSIASAVADASTTTTTASSPTTTTTTSTPSASTSVTTTIGIPIPSTTSSGEPILTSAIDSVPSRLNKTNIAVGSTIGAAGAVSIIGGLAYFWARKRRRRNTNTQTPDQHKDWRRTWKPESSRPAHGTGLAKFHTWRGQSYYARPDVKLIRVCHEPPPPVYYAELPATPLSFAFRGPDISLPPPVRSMTTRQMYAGTKPGKSQDRWSLR